MIAYLQSVLLGLLQGVTELFPISSLGHSVILPGLLHWNINQNAEDFLLFLVATHFATAFTLFIMYFADWKRIISGIFRSLAQREIKDHDAKLGWLLVASTVPAGFAGLLFQDQLKNLFASPLFASLFLAGNGLMLFLAETLRKQAKTVPDADTDQRIAQELSWWQAIKIGFLQVVALIPGFSRTGATLTGGLLMGLSHEDSLRYAFLLATPIIGAAAVLKLPELITSGNSQAITAALIGGLFAAGAAWASATFLEKYFKTKTLIPFAWYCLVAGLLSFIALVVA